MKSLSLAEILIVIGGIGFFLVGSYFAFNIFLKVDKDLNQKVSAMYLAVEGVEIVRQIRDTSFLQDEEFDAEFVGKFNKSLVPVRSGETWELIDSSANPSLQKIYLTNEGFLQRSDTSPPPDWKETQFRRWIKITHVSADEIKVQVFVAYGSKIYSFIEDHLYDWR